MTGIFIQARSDSNRLPNKFKLDIKGKSLIQRVYETCLLVSKPVVIVPHGDHEIIAHLKNLYIPYFEGDKNVLVNRYLDAAKTFKVDNVVRVTGDCPCLNPSTLRDIISFCEKNRIDFGSNAFSDRNTIDGEDIEFLSVRALQWLKMRIPHTTPGELEHCTAHLYNNIYSFMSDGLKSHNFKSHINLFNIIKTSIDTQEDLEHVRSLL